ncbi:MAG: hypothetical protein EOO89_13495, partial [Pedobacter sp.]
GCVCLDFNSWLSSYGNKAFYMNRTERFVNGKFLSSNYRKKPFEKSFAHVPFDPPYQLKWLDTNIQYLKLTNFNASDENKVISKQFYNSIKDSLTASNLIVDLRNNGGGYYSISSQFLNLLRRYADPGKIYALLNYKTVSNAEQFSIKLKDIGNVTLLGEQTMGRIAYGHNYGTKFTLPSKKFMITPTDLGGEPKDVVYEAVGIPVNIILDQSKDWIEQVKVIIQQKSKISNN